MDHAVCVSDVDGREVVMDTRTFAHLAARRPWLLDHIEAICATIALPFYREDDPAPGRERFYARHLLLPARWLRVIVDFNEQPGWVVTVFIQRRDPRRQAR